MPLISQEHEPDDPVFFWRPGENRGEFCQWYLSPFTVSKRRIAELVERDFEDDEEQDGNPDGYITFGCAEHFMMFCKAARF